VFPKKVITWHCECHRNDCEHAKSMPWSRGLLLIPYAFSWSSMDGMCAGNNFALSTKLFQHIFLLLFLFLWISIGLVFFLFLLCSCRLCFFTDSVLQRNMW
jgi:hypothetical protein